MNTGPKRILHIVSSMDRGGAETLIMNIYRNLDRTKVQFDFVTHSARQGDYEEEIVKLGGKIYKIRSLGQLGPYSYIKELKKIMKDHSYIAVHSHTDYQAGFPALAAKLAGIEKRICHSHSTNWPRKNSPLHRAGLHILRTIIKLSATNYCSCSSEAAEFLFGRDAAASGKVQILKNGIDLTEFTRTETNRGSEIVKEFHLPQDAKLIGHVGRFSQSKNQVFILKVLKRLIETDKSYYAILVGDGPLKEQMEEEAKKLGIENHIRFPGVRADISRLMESFDVFLFPSKFEGFGIVTIEAQCAGTPCVISNQVPSITDMGLGLATFLSLEDELDLWCEKIQDAVHLERPNNAVITKAISNQGYNIKSNVKGWLELYGSS